MVARSRSPSSSTALRSSSIADGVPCRYRTAANSRLGWRLPVGSPTRKARTSGSSATAIASRAYSGEASAASTWANRRYPVAMRSRSSAAIPAGSQAVSDSLLLHLAEPDEWRAALTEGALRPPSLAEVGFVHLSTPDQVHLPAERLFPGRRDLVLLVVDPQRLRDPVRFEPGVPEDPASMRFPHLYGPLPTTAVIAVVPCRPPLAAVLPAPDDALGRALALQLSVPVRRAAEVRDVPGGVAVSDARFPRSRDDNRLLLSSPVDADTVEQTAATVAADAGWPARAATLRFPEAHDVALDLAHRGWSVEELTLMGRPATPVPGGERAEVVPQ